MATPVADAYSAPSGATLRAGAFASRITGGIALDALAPAGALGSNLSDLAGANALDDLAVSGSMAGYLALVSDDNLLNINEGTATTGWSIASGTGALSQSGSSVRLTSTAAGAVTAGLSLAGPASNDFIVLLKASAQYVGGQYATLRLRAASTPVLDISLGYDHAAGAAALGTLSAYSTPAAAGQVIATGINYETTPQQFAIHIDRDFACVNLFVKEAGGKWNFAGSFAFAANFAALDNIQIITSAHDGQWFEYDWVGYARPTMSSIGDSICAGHNGFDPVPNYYAGVDNYASTWQKHATLFPALRNTLITNKGIGGQTSTQILSRISQVTSPTPRLVFLHASSNDFGQGVSQSTRDSNIQASINAITATGAKVVLLNAMYGTSGHSQNVSPVGGLRDYMLDWWTNRRPSMTGLSASIDIMTPVKDGSNYQQASLSADTIHPNVAGYTLIGAQIAAAGL